MSNAIEQSTGGSAPHAGRSPVCACYIDPPRVYDEMHQPDVSPRRHWQSFLSAMERMGCDELERRRQEIIRQLRQNGMAYNIHGAPLGVYRHWQLDVVPLIISREEWAFLETGLIQRGRLLSRILADIYGPRELFQSGQLPADVVLAHPGFLRPCAGSLRPGLLFLAVDVVRTAEGAFHVIADRTQNPPGLGYALENRTVLANVMPDLFRECRVRRLSNFFRVVRDEIAGLSPRSTEASQIVMLSTGPRHEGYFDHAFLGAYLGYTPVLGDDLSVRDGYLHLRALDGLKRVDILFREVHDGACDPLEFDPASITGVPGLLETARRGNVVIANPLGSGILENNGMMPFLDPLCRALLGEPLALPAPATWWCGVEPDRAHVLSRLPELLIKRLSAAEKPIDGRRLTPAERRKLAERIRSRPARFVGQSPLDFATAPTLSRNQLSPLPARMRFYLLVRADGSVAVMPGGIARCVVQGRDTDEASGILKDIWVIAAQPERHVSLWRQAFPGGAPVSRQGVMPSRVAENLFWAGRYVERAEATARMILTLIRRQGENDIGDDETAAACTRRLTETLEGICGMPAPQPQPSLPEWMAGFQARVQALIQDKRNPGSLCATIHALLNAAQSVREHWSTYMWRIITILETHNRAIAGVAPFSLHRMEKDIGLMVNDLLAFTGLCMDSMSREPGWVLLDTGRRIERAITMAEVIRLSLTPVYSSPLDSLMMETVLTATENIITFRRRYRAVIHMEAVLDLLLMDDRNPRALIYQIERLQEHIAALPKSLERYRMSDQERHILKALSKLKLSSIPRVAAVHGNSDTHRHMELLMLHLKQLMEQISTALAQTYFIHSQPSRQLTGADPEVP